MSKQNKQREFADCLISKQAAMQIANELQISVDGYHMYNQAVNNYCAEIGGMKEAIVRCKDCVHRPTGTGANHDVEFPDDDWRCPCRCEDDWYNWIPDDDWFCKNGERITDA